MDHPFGWSDYCFDHVVLYIRMMHIATTRSKFHVAILVLDTCRLNLFLLIPIPTLINSMPSTRVKLLPRVPSAPVKLLKMIRLAF